MQIKKRQVLLKKNGFSILSKLINVLESTHINYFFTYGTLLGFVRNKNLIAHDNDIDIGIIKSDTFDWNYLQSVLEENGFIKLRQFILDNEITEQTYTIDNLSIDFFLYQYEENDSEHMYTYSYSRYPDIIYPDPAAHSVEKLKSSAINKIKKIIINDKAYRIPDNSELYLSEIYGEDWMVPNPDWLSKDGPNRQWISNKYALLEKHK